MASELVLVVGGATGIGAEVVRQMSTTGLRTAICDINESAGQQLADEIGGTFFYGDVADDASLGQAIAQSVDALGVPNYAVLNSGVMTAPSDEPFQSLEEVSLAAYRRVMSVNLDGVFHGLRHLIPLMRDEEGKRAITVTASRAGLVPTPPDAVYAASKAAVIQMVRSVAMGIRGSQLRINALCPGTVDTNLIADVVREFGVPLVSAADMASEITALLESGGNGEIRARLHDRPAFSVGTFNADVGFQEPGASEVAE